MSRLLSIIALAAVITTPARAEWEWTRWGMTTHAVRLAAPADLVRLDEPVGRSRLRMLLSVEIETMGIAAHARLGFSRAGELGMVELRPVDPVRDCPAAAEALSRRLGDPVSQRHTPSQRLLWSDDGTNLIEFRSAGDGACVIRLTPLPKRQPYLGG
ncbi:hypothetical protein [Aquibium sp. ELW1220]|uniref:hypothetical protein n=1 Tax=Aquibium sp. ELW1220 TaxID=2976766 RepID=UPI0025B1211B|nr:hypothetical protein [Aquibium sp. ELW1220]MDN2580165.1 hypothetical protein [Aquibium sp. ELW1220]